MSGTPPGRKVVFNDLRVIAALEALKAAVLAVNGDAKVVSEIVLLDVRMANGEKGMATLHMNICDCPGCVNRFVEMLGNEFNQAAAQYVRDKRRAVH